MICSVIIIIAAIVLLLVLRFVVCPLWVDKGSDFNFRNKTLNLVPLPHEMEHRHFWSFLGTGEVLLGSFGDWGDITYDFICILYVPIFPVGCYSVYQGKNRKHWKRMLLMWAKKVSGIQIGTYTNIKWSWREVVYIYVRQCLLIILFVSLLYTIYHVK